MNKYLITLNGCDDTTECEIELTKEQLETFMQIAKEINKKALINVNQLLAFMKNTKKMIMVIFIIGMKNVLIC